MTTVFSTIPNKAWRYLISGNLCLLLIPLVSMQFTSEVSWQLLDFIVAGVLLFICGSVLLAIRYSTMRGLTKVFVGVTVLLVLVLIWAELAVGIFH